MDQRDIAGLPCLHTQADADQIGHHLIQPGRFGVHRDIAAFVDAIDPDLQCCSVADLLISSCVKRNVRRLWRIVRRGGGGIGDDRCFDAQLIGDAFGQRAKLHFRQKRHQHFRIRVAHFQIIECEIQRRVLVQQNQLTRQPDLVGIFDERFAPLGLFDFFRPFQQRVQITVFIDQQRGCLDPDARRAGYVIYRIACQRLNIHHAFGIDAKLLQHPFAIDPDVFHRIQHFDTVTDQLHQVFVGRYDCTAATGLAGLDCKGRDDVVCLEPFFFLARNVECFCRAPGQWNLWAQLFGHRLAIGLVLVIHVVAKCVASLVEDHRNMCGCIRAGVRLDIAIDHVAKAGHGADGQPVGFAGQWRQRMKCAKDKGRPVDQVQVVSLAECHACLLRFAMPVHGLPGDGCPVGERICACMMRGTTPFRRDPCARICNRNSRIRPSPCPPGSGATHGDGQARLRLRRRRCGSGRQSWFPAR